jgi:hypothetical protein
VKLRNPFRRVQDDADLTKPYPCKVQREVLPYSQNEARRRKKRGEKIVGKIEDMATCQSFDEAVAQVIALSKADKGLRNETAYHIVNLDGSRITDDQMK